MMTETIKKKKKKMSHNLALTLKTPSGKMTFCPHHNFFLVLHLAIQGQSKGIYFILKTTTTNTFYSLLIYERLFSVTTKEKKSYINIYFV